MEIIKMNEEFKISKLYPPFAANALGQILNTKTNYIRTPTVGKIGYVVVGTRQGMYYAHRIVADAWLPNPENKEQVNHKNCDKSDNRVSNLEWVTSSENSVHAFENGRLVFNGNCGEDSNLTKYSESQIREVCELLMEGCRNVDISKRTGISTAYIKNLKAKKQWKNITESYEFPVKSKLVSEATVRWICKQILLGKGNTEILHLSTSTTLTLHAIKSIRYKTSYMSISKDYF